MINIKKQILNQQNKYYNNYLKIKDNPRYKSAWKFVIDNIDKDAKILDIGCANGDFSEKLIKLGYNNCYGLEIVDEAIKESSKKGINVIKGSFLNKFPFSDNWFDFIFAGETVEHTIDDNFFLSECYRCLKKGGYLILTTPNLVSFSNRILMLFGRMSRFAYNEFHYRIYNMKTISNKLTLCNFKIIKKISSYILVSTFFNKFLGIFGEFLGLLFPNFGEHLIIYCLKNK